MARDTVGRAPALPRHRAWDEGARDSGGPVWRTWLQANAKTHHPRLGGLPCLPLLWSHLAQWSCSVWQSCCVHLGSCNHVRTWSWRRSRGCEEKVSKDWCEEKVSKDRFSRLWSRRPSQRCQNCQKGEQGKIFETVEQETFPEMSELSER